MTTTQKLPHVRTVIVGAGFAGLGMGIRLKRRGDDDFVIVERAGDVGGTWRDNHYPGVACDVPSHVYSFSFRPNPNWSRVFSPGPEIQQYMRDCATDERLMPHIRFNSDVTRAQWDAANQRWQVETTNGNWTSDFLITGTGHLADEHLPNIPGLDTFTGEKFHSARWDDDADLAGKRIGVVGTGASAIQIIPEMVKVGSQVVVFQRTPAYVIPRTDRAYREGEKRLFRRDPSAITDLRSELFWVQENTYAQRRAVPQFLEAARKLALDHLAAQVPEGELRDKLTPTYEPGCKRILISNTYYPAMASPVTTVEASALDHIEGGTAVAASGERYDLDVLVFATGFEATEPPFAKLVFDGEGRSLADHWSTGMEAFDSTAVAGFPNLFIINGPNTSLGHNSIVYIIESQVEYILEAMDHLQQTGMRAMVPSDAAQKQYVDTIQDEAQGTVWLNGHCQSWYVDQRSGKLTLIWPDFGFAFREHNGHFDPEGYEFQPALATARM